MSRLKFDIITEALSHIALKVSINNHLNLQDINIYLENFFRDILNIIFSGERTFSNLNKIEGNFAAIDLGDDKNEYAIQVTSTTSLPKVKHTIETYKSEYGYKKLIMLYAKVDKPNRVNNINEEGKGIIEIEEWSIKDLCKKMEDLDDDKIAKIQKIVVNQITPSLYDNYTKLSDKSASDDYDNLEQKDIRNISDKLTEVCPSINKFRILKYSKDIASGEAELNLFSERDVRALKYRIFEVCQDELIAFCETFDTSNKIDFDTVNNLLDKFTNQACLIIEEKSKDYAYPLKNRDLLRKVVLALINGRLTCFSDKLKMLN